jgi:uncharacterized protein
MKRATSGWVTGDRFWNRTHEMELFLEYLREGTNLLLTGQRRIGKTSLLREAARRLEGEFICLQVGLQGAASSQDAVAELSAATHSYTPLWDRVKSWAAGLSERISEMSIHDIKVVLRAAITEGDWREKGDHLFSVLAESRQPVAVFFDELPILVNRLLKGEDYTITPERRRQADQFLSWLRQNCQRHQGRVRVVVTGSIGLEPIVRQAGLSATVNHFKSFELPAWDRETAADCLRALAREYALPITAPVIDAMLAEIGVFIPHHVQVFFENVHETYRLRKLTAITASTVKYVYKHKMLGARGHAELSHLEERLKMVLGVHLQGLAIELLTEAAVTGHLSGDAAVYLAKDYLDPYDPSILREILDILDHDGYLERRGDRYTFASKLQRDWWKSRFQFLYQPVSERRRPR